MFKCFQTSDLDLPTSIRCSMNMTKENGDSESDVLFPLVLNLLCRRGCRDFKETHQIFTLHGPHAIFSHSGPDVELNECEFVYF